jgi:type II secretory pathway component GspD/PulD (secretin)
MNRIVIPALLLAALLAFSLSPAGAQQAQPKPEFKDAPVTDVLLWAQKSIGVGFVYDGKVLNDPATGQLRRVTASHVEPQTRPEKTLLLFEILKRCGLVAFEVGGMPGPTYHLYAADGAARNAAIVNSINELEGMYFASLAIKLRRAAVQSVAPRIRPKLSEGVGSLEVFEDTHSMIVSDFADRLLVAWEIAMAADQPSMRDDDLVVQDYAVRNGLAARFEAAIERLRESNEGWKATVNETSNLLLISGRRDEVGKVIDRLRLLDSKPENPAFKQTTQTIKLIYLTPADAVGTLRQMFEAQIAAGSVQVGGFERDRKVVFSGSEFDLERAKAAIKAIDTRQEAGEKK